jgi:hypothetical protein
MRSRMRALLPLPFLLPFLLPACAVPSPPADDEAAESSSTATDAPDDDDDDGPTIVCMPGELRCLDDLTLDTCSATGLGWESAACDTYQVCQPCFLEQQGNCVASCVGPCEQLIDQPSSQGCSFYATSMFQALPMLPELPPDALVIGNPDTDRIATVELRFVPEGTNQEQLAEGPIMLEPGETHVFLLDPELTEYFEQTSLYRSGAVQHLVSDLPIVAYLHSPYEGSSTNGSSLLLPEHVLRNDYVVYGYPAYVTPSYFIVIAMEDQTTLRWTPPVETAGDALPLAFVEGGQVGEQLLNRFDNVRIDTSDKYLRPRCEQDLSGTVVSADKPIWVMSAVRGLRVPFCATSFEIPGCAPPAPILEECGGGSDFVQEQNLPLETWGQIYVGPASPVRADEDHYWRIYSGADDVSVDVFPPQPGSPFVLVERGDFVDLVVPNGTDLVFESDGPFMPIQYVAGNYVAGGIGSPAMVQMVPIEQFLDRYVFVTGFAYDFHYVQVIRPSGEANVLLDGVVVDTWSSVGDWEIATVLISEGTHEIHGDVSFGIVQYGYSTYIDSATNSAGYAYPGGMLAETIFIP